MNIKIIYVIIFVYSYYHIFLQYFSKFIHSQNKLKYYFKRANKFVCKNMQKTAKFCVIQKIIPNT